jgi:gamma-glutamyltranspeptidase/glutathione hydrolase
VTRGPALEDRIVQGGFPHEQSGWIVMSPLVWAAAMLLIPGCGSQGPAAPTAAVSGAVSSATPEATAAGIRVLALGGNAVDAAVAISLALGVAEPSESGLGGTVVMLVTRPSADPVVIHATRYVVHATGPTPGSFLRPTMVPVLVHAWREYGSGNVSWEQVVEPAQRLAENGYSLGRFRHLMMVKEYPRIEGDSVASALLLNSDRSIPGEGTRVRLPALATTLERLADADPDVLPGGDFAELLGSDLAGLMDATAASALSAPAEVREDTPLAGRYRGWSVLVPGDPYGGARLLRALELLQSAPVDVLEQEGESRTAWLAEALSYAIAPQDIRLDAYLAALPRLPRTVADPMLRRVRRRAAAPLSSPSLDAGVRPPASSHFSVADATGIAVSVTQSLGRAFGERASRLGFFLASAPEGASLGSDPDSWSVPTVLTRQGEVGLVLGSSGGPRALSAVVQAVTDWVDGGHPADSAVAAPRLYMEADPGRRPRMVLEGVIWVDPMGGSRASLEPWGEGVRKLAAARGFGVGERDTGPQDLGLIPFFGSVHAVAWDADGWAPAADPRRDGVGRVLLDEDVLRARE